MDALELIQLGRRLTRIGEAALRGGSGGTLPVGPSLVLQEAFRSPDSSINEIVDRTGLPQSYVSESVSKLRDQGVLTTSADPKDGRRILVRVTAKHVRTVARRGRAGIDTALAAAVREPSDGALEEMLSALELLSLRLIPSTPGPVVRRLRGGDEDGAGSLARTAGKDG